MHVHEYANREPRARAHTGAHERVTRKRNADNGEVLSAITRASRDYEIWNDFMGARW